MSTRYTHTLSASLKSMCFLLAMWKFTIFNLFLFCVCIDLFYSKSAFHLTFKIEVSMVQQLPKPLPSHNYGTVIQVCLTANLGQEVLQIYCSCFFINYQWLQLLDFKRDQYSKGTLSAD